MRQSDPRRIAELIASPEPPCVSLYQPTHRHHPDNQQDPIRYRNLVRDLEASLAQAYPKREVRAMVEKFQALSHDDRFWNHRTDGLAILAANGAFEVFELQRTVPERVVVADSFHVKPLLRILQSADRYQVLALSRQEVRLYEGNRDVLDEVELTKVPKTITEALGEELTEPHQTVASYGRGAGHQMYHGHGAKTDEVDKDRDRFFRVIDRALLEHHTSRSDLPLMLAALTEHHAPFREISKNPRLMPDGLMTNPESLSLDQLRTQAWAKVEPIYLSRLSRLSDDYQTAKARGLATDVLTEAAAATVAGRVGMLLVEAERTVPGRIDMDTGEVRPGKLSDPDTDDLLDDLAELVLRRKGDVVVVPADRMPTRTGLAATYRF